jgi:hypothetical protein
MSVSKSFFPQCFELFAERSGFLPERNNTMRKRQRVWYRTIFYYGWLREAAASRADHTDPAQRDDLEYLIAPRFRPLAPIIHEGNYNEWSPADPNNRWVRVRHMRLNSPAKIRRLSNRREQRRYRRQVKYFAD